MNKVLVLGASLKEGRYSNMAIRKLAAHGFGVAGLGHLEGDVSGVPIHKEPFQFENLYAVTVYLNSFNQKSFYDYIIDLKPEKVIFNPGAENIEFESLLEEHGIFSERACTLVLLSLNQF